MPSEYVSPVVPLRISKVNCGAKKGSTKATPKNGTSVLAIRRAIPRTATLARDNRFRSSNSATPVATSEHGMKNTFGLDPAYEKGTLLAITIASTKV